MSETKISVSKKSEVVELKNEINELKNTIKELIEIMKIDDDLNKQKPAFLMSKGVLFI